MNRDEPMRMAIKMSSLGTNHSMRSKRIKLIFHKNKQKIVNFTILNKYKFKTSQLTPRESC